MDLVLVEKLHNQAKRYYNFTHNVLIVWSTFSALLLAAFFFCFWQTFRCTQKYGIYFLFFAQIFCINFIIITTIYNQMWNITIVIVNIFRTNDENKTNQNWIERKVRKNKKSVVQKKKKKPIREDGVSILFRCYLFRFHILYFGEMLKNKCNLYALNITCGDVL